MLLGCGVAVGADVGVGVGVALGLRDRFRPVAFVRNGAGLVPDGAEVPDGVGFDVACGETPGFLRPFTFAVWVGDGLGGMLGEDELLGDPWSLGLALPPGRQEFAALSTVDVAGGDGQTELAVAAGEAAPRAPTISRAAPTGPSPIAAPSAVGLTNSALTRAPSLSQPVPSGPSALSVLATLLGARSASDCVP